MIPSCTTRKHISSLFFAKADTIKCIYIYPQDFALFHLLCNSSYLYCLWLWTSKEMVTTGTRTTFLWMNEPHVYWDFEMAASICPLNRLADNWAEFNLFRNNYFKVISLDGFMNLSVKIRPYAKYDHEIFVIYLHWHIRNVPEHFSRNPDSGLSIRNEFSRRKYCAM